jgi:hypothetical protein
MSGLAANVQMFFIQIMLRNSKKKTRPNITVFKGRCKSKNVASSVHYCGATSGLLEEENLRKNVKLALATITQLWSPVAKYVLRICALQALLWQGKSSISGESSSPCLPTLPV